MSLFKLGDFKLAGGQQSPFKIQCEHLTFDDWNTLAYLAVQILKPFKMVCAVPTGGFPFGAALAQYQTWNKKDPILIADDVFTTGKSIINFKDKYFSRDNVIGVVAFNRAKLLPHWVVGVWNLGI